MWDETFAGPGLNAQLLSASHLTSRCSHWCKDVCTVLRRKCTDLSTWLYWVVYGQDFSSTTDPTVSFCQHDKLLGCETGVWLARVRSVLHSRGCCLAAGRTVGQLQRCFQWPESCPRSSDSISVSPSLLPYSSPRRPRRALSYSLKDELKPASCEDLK